MSSNSNENVPERFQGKDFYEILEVPRNASENDIKRAYRKASLKYHPDKSNSPNATEEFAYLAKIHETLSDPQARAYYDETGQTEPAADEAASNAYDYWREIFPKISVDDIDQYEERYKGSQEELDDIKDAYERGHEDLATIFEYVPFSNLDNLDRILTILQENLGAHYTRTQINNFKRKQEKFENREEKEAEEAKSWLEQSLKPGEKQLYLQNGPDAGLFAVIQARQAARKNWLNDLEDRYTNQYIYPLESTTSFKSSKSSKSSKSTKSTKSSKSKTRKQTGPTLNDQDFEAYQAPLFSNNNQSTRTSRR